MPEAKVIKMNIPPAKRFMRFLVTQLGMMEDTSAYNRVFERQIVGGGNVLPAFLRIDTCIVNGTNPEFNTDELKVQVIRKWASETGFTAEEAIIWESTSVNIDPKKIKRLCALVRKRARIGWKKGLAGWKMGRPSEKAAEVEKQNAAELKHRAEKNNAEIKKKGYDKTEEIYTNVPVRTSGSPASKKQEDFYKKLSGTYLVPGTTKEAASLLIADLMKQRRDKSKDNPASAKQVKLILKMSGVDISASTITTRQASDLITTLFPLSRKKGNKNDAAKAVHQFVARHGK